MPYIVINDNGQPVHYYCGQGFRQGLDTTVEEHAAQRFPTLVAANDFMRANDAPHLYARGWRIVPVDKLPR